MLLLVDIAYSTVEKELEQTLKSEISFQANKTVQLTNTHNQIQTDQIMSNGNDQDDTRGDKLCNKLDS